MQGFSEIDRKLVQGNILQGSLVDIGLKWFFCKGKVFSCNWVRASARKVGEKGWARKPSFGGCGPVKMVRVVLVAFSEV